MAGVVGIAIVAVLVVWGALVLRLRMGPTMTADKTLPASCRELAFEAVLYVVCEVDAASHEISLHHTDRAGKPFGSLGALALEAPFDFAMNAGMYHEDTSPVGLYVENGVERTPLNRSDGFGNFFMKPNGVFFVDRQGRAGVEETEAFAAAGDDVWMATQSGPMLVIDGSIHPRFEPNGSSRYIRNGVGVSESKTVVFAISREPVSLGSFARLFRDGLGCPNALFFDGAISALHDGQQYVEGGGFPTGPMVAVRGR
ncbi:phosphodiester glycosidase family protein [Arvimicrobium flavum]|uniref:phosphodiester glycosidase family protein n=1 Tax=Arvimicrobium flavum TaxID=3393320 RepID=UPI00398C8C88